MLIFFKHCIKTSFLILLFSSVINNTVALNSASCEKGFTLTQGPVKTAELNVIQDSESALFSINDSVRTVQNDSLKATEKNEKVTVPADLVKSPIKFQVNSYIYYLSIRHFISNQAKSLFIQGWNQEKKLLQLSTLADSLRNAYSTASSEQREQIASQILKAEEQSIAFNEEIAADYQKARELEDQYWQSASMDEIAQFQKKISAYDDSIHQSTQQTAHSEVQDTITVYRASGSSKAEEKKVEVPVGITYKIQIGAYKGKIPEASNKLIKKISLIRKVENYVDDKGVKTYTTGNLKTYSEAETMLSQVKQEGIKNALITAYQNGKKIPVTDAKKINKEL